MGAPMAKMIGEAARYTTAQSIRVFQRMLITTMLMVAAVGVFEGVDLSVIVLRWGQTGWAYIGFALLGLAGIFHLCRYQSQRIDHYERERKRWRKGAAGECMVADVLAALPDNYSVINDVTTASGNLDHIVVGPTGLFSIETKNWRGRVTADGKGELISNGTPSSKPYVRKFLSRSMCVLEQIRSLARRDDIFIRAVMVFPKAWVEAPYGSTGRVHCVTDETLCNYIEDTKYSDELAPENVSEIQRALEAIASMEPEFATAATAAVNRSKKGPAIVAAVAPTRT
jgi:uncharacterized membrane protein YuzA (DUF378 family)